jgi:hypothetical protein
MLMLINAPKITNVVNVERNFVGEVNLEDMQNLFMDRLLLKVLSAHYATNQLS